MNREAYLKRTYGITEAQYKDLLKKQKSSCAVCLRHQREFTSRLCVDHDHKSGELRGLLCHYCNHRLVGRHRDADLLQRITDYIRGPHTGWFVPIKKKRRRKRKSR